MRKPGALLPFVLCAILLASAIGTPAAQRKQKTAPSVSLLPAVLQPKLVPGDVLRYQIEFQTTSDTKAGGAVADPEGPSRVVVTWDAQVRLEVLAGPENASGGTRRLRATYEHSSATFQSDSPDPQADAVVGQYRQLEGRSIEFALAADGSVTAVSGLDGVISDQSTASAAQQWIAQLSSGGIAPAAGASPGVTWSSQQNADSLPLAGLVWRTDSTYLRNDPCGQALPSAAVSQQDDNCAVVLTSLTLLPSRSKGDATPEEFRKNGLQSSGHWTGSGDSLSYVSQRTGWVVSASQSSTQEMDVNISSKLGSTVHYSGTISTHSQISLLPSESTAPPPAPAAKESSSQAPLAR